MTIRHIITFACICVAYPAQAEFCLLTQNALRLGHGEPAYAQAKRDTLRRIFADYGVVALQEVMAPDEVAAVTPEGFVAAVSPAKGAAYREHYAVLVRADAASILDQADYPDPDGSFIRPPFGVAVEDESGAYWVVSFHALFGTGGKAPRRAEIAAMPAVVGWFATRDVPGAGPIERVVVAGDWNLPAEDPVFAAFAGAAALSAAPDIKTTLNRDGRYVSAYDRFVWPSAALGVSLAGEPRDNGGLDPASYRDRVSDHVGVAAWIAATPGTAHPEGVACPPDRAPLVAEAALP